MPSRLIAPAPASTQGLLALPPKVPGHVTVTMESSMPQTPAIPVATISGQQVRLPAHLRACSWGRSASEGRFTQAGFSFQGHSSNLHHLMAANVQIIRSSTPALQIGSSAPPPHTFTSHLPRGEVLGGM